MAGIYIILFGIGVCLVVLLFSCKRICGDSTQSARSDKAGSVEKKNYYNYSGVYRMADANVCNLTIEIRKDDHVYVYSIHGAGVKSSGKLAVEKDGEQVYLTFPGTLRSGDKSAVTGAYSDNAITIQNYGSSMNEYVCFKKCNIKYLRFIKYR